MTLTPEQDQQLISNGYEPIPVKGKAAVAEGWQTGIIDAARIVNLRSAHHDANNTGLRTGLLSAIDIDVRDPAHAEQIAALADDVFGRTPLRRFGSKGIMLCYRNETPCRKITVACDAIQPGEFAEKIEILGSGLQFVGFGTHPETKQPFRWLGKTDFDEEANPLNTPLDTLPQVTPETLRLFAQQCAVLCGTLGYLNPRVREAYQQEKIERDEDAKEDEPHNLALAVTYLTNCVERGHVAVLGALGNDTIYEMACCLRDRYYLSIEKIEELMLTHWYPHCVPNTLEDECRLIISHAASYMQNAPGARVVPPAVSAFREALDKLPDKPAPGGSTDLGDAQQIIMQDENHDEEDQPTAASEYVGREFPPLRELVPVWCERNTNTFLEGPAATQKSRAALQDAICLSAGLPVLGKPVESCDTIYLNYENSPEEMARRVHMICSYLQGSNKNEPVNPKGVLIWELRKNPRPILTCSRDGVLITRFGRRFLSLVATRRNAGLHTLIIFDGLMDAVIFKDNTRNDDTVAMGIIRLIDSWCLEYDFTAYSIVHPSRSSERGGSVGSYATAWTTKPRAIQTFKRVLSNFAGGGAKAKITEDTPIDDIWYQRRVQKRSNGPEGDRMLLEYWKGGLRPHYPPSKQKALAVTPGPSEVEEFEEVEF